MMQTLSEYQNYTIDPTLDLVKQLESTRQTSHGFEGNQTVQDNIDCLFSI